VLVLLGLAGTAVVLSTHGSRRDLLNAVVDPGNWYSRGTTIVSLRFIGVALALCAVAIPALLKAHLLGEG
jgi:hypothetical protein